MDQSKGIIQTKRHPVFIIPFKSSSEKKDNKTSTKMNKTVKIQAKQTTYHFVSEINV